MSRPSDPPEVARWRGDTPGCDRLLHLNNAGAALQPASVREAVSAHLELEHEIGGYEASEARVDELSRAYEAVVDRSVVERAIRPLALNRKNALFAGSDSGAEHWAAIASLIETCKLTGVEPLGYLTDVISRIVNGHPQSRIDELLPWAYPITPTLKAVA